MSIMVSVAVRYTKAYVDSSGVVSKLALTSEKLVVYEHDDANRLHCHMLIVNSSKSVDTIRRWLRELFVNPARTDISMKESYSDASGQEVPVSDAFITYMSKGRYEPKYIKGYTSEDITHYRGRWVDYPRSNGIKAVGGKIVVGDKVAKGPKTKWQLLEEMQIEWGSNDAPDFDDLFKITRRVLVKNKQAIGFYKVMDYMEAFLYVHKKDTAMMMVRQMWDRKFSR